MAHQSPVAKAEYDKRYYARNRERVRRVQNAWYRNTYAARKDKINANLRERCARIKAEAFKAYGNKCACCELPDIRFLTFDHVNNDGAEHRRKVSGSWGFLNWLKRNNFPATIQLLCWNCNSAKHIYGKCPHQLDREK